MFVVVVHSGGLDSTVLLYDRIARGDKVAALSVNYGQRHAKELEYARAISEDLGILHECADLTSVTGLLGRNSLTSSSIPVPDGHYTEETMKVTVVPNRNMILLAVATAWAVSLRADVIAYGAHSGDHAIYPDCRPEFANALATAISLADWHPVRLETPFAGRSKAEVVRRGAELSVPFPRTWSCYKGGPLHCGTCGTCIERREAFYVAGVPDPTEYNADAVSAECLAANGWKLMR